MNALQNSFLMLLGPDGKGTELTLLHIVLRGFIIFIVGLAVVRIGDRRSLAEKTAFDAIFIVLVGSMLSRAINGTAPFFTTIGAGIALMIIHRRLRLRRLQVPLVRQADRARSRGRFAARRQDGRHL